MYSIASSKFPLVLLFGGVFLSVSFLFTPTSSHAATAAAVSSPFLYTFNVEGTLMEAGSMGESSSPYFWLNSGGKFLIREGIGETPQGSLLSGDTTRLQYAKMNPLDTESGFIPQNTLRLVTRSMWGNSQETVKFRITKTNLTNTPNRDGYSGVFLFGRYKDQYNLYYVGVRHDGQAVIKKKINGTYYTIAEKQVFGVQASYDKTTNPNLMPEWQWMGLRATFENLANGSVRIRLFLDKNNSGVYAQILSIDDAGVGGAPFTAKGYSGIRGDYMNLQFDNFELRTI